MSLPPAWLDRAEVDFPDPSTALREPNGLLAIGGRLTPQTLIQAYRRGIFPWYEDPQPVLWWSPDPRAVIITGQLHLSRSLRKTLRSGRFQVTFDRQFEQVIDNCARLRKHREGTWITPELRAAYLELHEMGFAHSIEVTHRGRLQGGLYGLALGKVFFGESMFSLQANASKVGLFALDAYLRHHGYQLIDCQVESEHLRSMGAIAMPREQFLKMLERYAGDGNPQRRWQRPEEVAELGLLL
jgi:leucyl/phenylalanyl-tRNA--protein transferase